MVAPAGAHSQNSSSRYFTIGRSEALDVWTPSDILVQNLNLDFNVVWLQTIMESIQHMTPEGSSLPALAQQRANATNHVIAVERSVSNHRRKPSIGNKSGGCAKCAQSEAASLASDNRRLADNDVRRRIMQNRSQQEYGCDRDNLCNVIDDWRHHRARSPTPPQRSLARYVTPSGRGGFRALLHRSSRSSGQRSLSPGILTSMTSPAIQKNSSRSIILSFRPREEMIG
jgi:hypothetical protein